eukprot:SAG11_NODE_1101_length_5868_cov_2.045935_3_plen_152_part_00
MPRHSTIRALRAATTDRKKSKTSKSWDNAHLLTSVRFAGQHLLDAAIATNVLHHDRCNACSAFKSYAKPKRDVYVLAIFDFSFPWCACCVWCVVCLAYDYRKQHLLGSMLSSVVRNDATQLCKNENQKLTSSAQRWPSCLAIYQAGRHAST